MSSIEWTDRTWNPTVGCSRVSPGCEHCYAEGVAHRGMQPAHRGLTVLSKNGPRWNGKVRLLPDRLEAPILWKKPQRVFVDSMSDLFHEKIPFEYIARVFRIMATARRHTFQVLTKRPARMLEFFLWLDETGEWNADPDERFRTADWPIPNVWLGVSVENQQYADERIPDLVRCPAAVRFLSVEPMLGPVELRLNRASVLVDGEYKPLHRRLHWVICGGESGAKAREFDVAWARALRDECASCDVPFFLKQMGAKPVLWHAGGDGEPELVPQYLELESGKGGKMREWPEDLQVRQWPESQEVHG